MKLSATRNSENSSQFAWKALLAPAACALALCMILAACGGTSRRLSDQAPAQSAALAQAAAPSQAVAAPLLPASSPATAAAADFTSSVTVVHFHSAALGREAEYRVILPGPLEPGRRYPVVYLLHGAYGQPSDWTGPIRAAEAVAGRELIAVAPEGKTAWYVDSPVAEGSNYETFVTRDVIADVDARLPTIASREGRGLAGYSMGGHGAFTLAARHPDLFSAASSMSGILHIRLHPGKWLMNGVMGDPAASEENESFWREHDACDQADAFANADVALLFDTGVSDATGCVEDNRRLDERLTNRGIVHTYREFPGGHSQTYWRTHLPEHLDFHAANFRTRLAKSPSAAQTPTTSTLGRQVHGKWHLHYVERALAFERENAERWDIPGVPRPVVLLGSSSMELAERYKTFDDFIVANRGISADGMGLGGGRGLLHRLYCSAIDCHPRAVIIKNGRNDLASTAKTGKPAIGEIADAMAEIISRIQKGVPDADIFVVSSFPTRDKYEFMAALVPQLNAAYREVASKAGAKVHFVDVFPQLAEGSGSNLLRPEYSSDGLHLSREGYKIIREAFVGALASAGIQPNPSTGAIPSSQ